MENRPIDQFPVSGFLFPVFHLFSVRLKTQDFTCKRLRGAARRQPRRRDHHEAVRSPRVQSGKVGELLCELLTFESLCRALAALGHQTNLDPAVKSGGNALEHAEGVALVIGILKASDDGLFRSDKVR